MASSDNGVYFRRAIVSDFDAVMDLGDQYGGRDYLMAVYKELMRSTTSAGVVAVNGSLVVGFYLVTAFDGGQTLMKRAARVHEKYRGRGIYNTLEAELEKLAKELFPHAVYETVANTNFQDHLAERFRAKGYSEIYRKRVLPMHCGFSQDQLNLPKESNSNPQPHIDRLNCDDLRLLFNTEITSRALFPKNRLFNFYLGYRLLEDNIPNLLCHQGGAFASLYQNDLDTIPINPERFVGQEVRADGHHGLKRDGFLNDINVNHVAMVTFHFCFPTRTSFLYFLDMYAKPEVPINHLQTHLARNLQTLHSYFPQQGGIFCITFDNNIRETDVTSCLTKMGIVDKMSDQETWQVLYERSLVGL